MDKDEARNLLSLDDYDLSEVIKILPDTEAASFFSKLSIIERKILFGKADPLSCIKILFFLEDKMIGRTILSLIASEKAIAIGRQMWRKKKQRIINHAEDKNKRMLHSILYSDIKVHHLTK